MVTRVLGKKGLYTLKIGDRLVHSLYDPEKEASRIVSSFSLFPCSRYVILLGLGLGYAAKELKSRFPGVVFLVVDEKPIPAQWREPALGSEPFRVWDQNQPLGDFLLSYIDEVDLPLTEIKILGLSPPKNLAEVKAAFGRMREHLLPNIKTDMEYGQRWIENSFTNFTRPPQLWELRPEARDIETAIIVSCGPSLGECEAQYLKARQSSDFILAMTGSAPYLAAHKIIPDAFITIDPGFASQRYLDNVSADAVVFAPSTALLDLPTCPERRCAIFSTAQSWEQEIIKSLNIASIQLLPSLGSVSLSALFLAQSLFPSAKIGLLGYDFRESALPYSPGHPKRERALLAQQRLNPAISGPLTKSITQSPLYAWRLEKMLQSNKTTVARGLEECQNLETGAKPTSPLFRPMSALTKDRRASAVKEAKKAIVSSLLKAAENQPLILTEETASYLAILRPSSYLKTPPSRRQEIFKTLLKELAASPIFADK